MHVCGQTLVLVDNDATVSAVYQKLMKMTLKYLFYHAPENRTFCLSAYEHDITSEEVYTDNINDLVCDVDRIDFAAKDSNLCDTLTEVVTRWKDSDFACRDILVFTDGLEGAELAHEKEELYYLTGNSEYPIYIVMLDQENNSLERKGMSAIAVTSGGRFFGTEFPGSDAESDRQLSEMITSAMNEYAEVHWKKYETDGDDETTGTAAGESVKEEIVDNAPIDEDSQEEDAIPADEYLSEGAQNEGVIYEYDRTPGFWESKSALILSCVLIAIGLLAAVLGSFVIMKKRRKSETSLLPASDDEDFFEDYELKGYKTTDLVRPEDGATVLLDDGYDSKDTATRLLCDDLPVISLSDTDDPKRQYRIVLGGTMTIGRGDCDVVITGDDALSKKHCEIYEKDKQIYVRDLSSSNGTKINRKKITEECLNDSDELTIGARTYIVGIA